MTDFEPSILDNVHVVSTSPEESEDVEKNGKVPNGKWPFQTLEHIKKLDLPERGPLIGPFYSASTIVVAAARGTGKTIRMTEIADAVASGNSFCNWQCEKQGPVAFVQLDMPIQAVQNRAQGRTWHEDLNYITRWHFQRSGMPTPDIGNPEHHALIITALKGYAMVVFDTRRAIQPPGQGSASNMWNPSYWLASAPVRHSLADAGVCLVFLDHLTHSGEVKDTKAIEDDVDSVITLKDSDKGTEDLCFHVEMSKDRDNIGEECFFELGAKWNQFTETSVKREVWQYRNNHTVKETAERFGIGERTVKNYVRQINSEEREERQAWMAEKPEGQGAGTLA